MVWLCELLVLTGTYLWYNRTTRYPPTTTIRYLQHGIEYESVQVLCCALSAAPVKVVIRVYRVFGISLCSLWIGGYVVCGLPTSQVQGAITSMRVNTG